MFDLFVDLTEPICQKLNPALADMTIFDTSGIEAWITEKSASLHSFQASHSSITTLHLLGCKMFDFTNRMSYNVYMT